MLAYTKLWLANDEHEQYARTPQIRPSAHPPINHPQNGTKKCNEVIAKKVRDTVYLSDK